jgi:hypothetical protein
MTHSSERTAGSVSAKAIVWGFVLAAAALSARDIVTLFGRLGTPVPLVYLAPVFIDGVTWLGMLLTGHHLSKRTNALGFAYLTLGGIASTFANWTAGETTGMRLLGVMAVAGFVLGKVALVFIEPRPAPPVRPVVDAATRARRSEAARKAAATRAANQAKAKRIPRTRVSKARTRQLELAWDLPEAPVSPAP